MKNCILHGSLQFLNISTFCKLSKSFSKRCILMPIFQKTLSDLLIWWPCPCPSFPPDAYPVPAPKDQKDCSMFQNTWFPRQHSIARVKPIIFVKNQAIQWHARVCCLQSMSCASYDVLKFRKGKCYYKRSLPSASAYGSTHVWWSTWREIWFDQSRRRCVSRELCRTCGIGGARIHFFIQRIFSFDQEPFWPSPRNLNRYTMTIALAFLPVQ